MIFLTNRTSFIFVLVKYLLDPISIHSLQDSPLSLFSSSLLYIYLKLFFPLFFFFLTKTCLRLSHLKKNHSQNPPCTYSCLGTSLSFILTVIGSSWYFACTCCLLFHLPSASQHWQSGFLWNLPSHQDFHFPLSNKYI